MSTYYLNRFPDPPLEVQIEQDPPPCLYCDRPVTRLSMGGPLICVPCDMGQNEDGTRLTAAQQARHRRRAAEKIEAYRAGLVPGPPQVADPAADADDGKGAESWPLRGITIGNQTPFGGESAVADEDMIRYPLEPTSFFTQKTFMGPVVVTIDDRPVPPDVAQRLFVDVEKKP